MQNLGFVYELYMFLIFKNCLVSFSKETLLFRHESLMKQLFKAILLITQTFIVSSSLMLLIKTVLFTFCSTKKETKSKKQRQRF